MHPADMEVYRHHQTQNFRKAGWQALNKIQRIFFFWRLLIPKGYTQAQYLANPVSDNFLPVREGDAFDLGGVTLRVVEIPGHTPGSIGLLCPEKKLFLCIFPAAGSHGTSIRRPGRNRCTVKTPARVFTWYTLICSPTLE